jgi:hypothetical protein
MRNGWLHRSFPLAARWLEGGWLLFQNKTFLYLGVAGGLLTGLLFYSQTAARHGDEGFHLLAAKLINAGKRPYIDFFYQHPPLYPYITAGWMRLFGENWRSAHVMSVLLTAACIILAAEYVFSRLDTAGWRLAGPIIVSLLIGSQFLVIQFGTIGEPYALCLFLIVAAFRLAVGANGGKDLRPLWAGLCAGAAAMSSLLSAPVAPIILLWLGRHTDKGGRFRCCGLFLAGVAIASLPLLSLAARAPGQTIFDIVIYHAFYRSPSFFVFVKWDIFIVTGWLYSSRGLSMALLAAIGLLFVAGRSSWATARRELYLCAWLTVGLGAYIATAHPTFPQYFVLLIPFVGILATMGVYAIGSGLWTPGQPRWPALVAVGLLALGMVQPAYYGREALGPRWSEYEVLAQEVGRLTPKDGLLWAPEKVYFAAGRTPPPGLENSNSLGSRSFPAWAASRHAVSISQVDQWVKAGRFDTVCICAAPEQVAALGLPRPYSKQKTLKDCYIFWERNSDVSAAR